jgi:amidase
MPVATNHLSATEVIASVHSGDRTATDTVSAALARAEGAVRFGAIQQLFAEDALAAAGTLDSRTDLASLPLAGLPVLVKDNVQVAGHPMRGGSQASTQDPATDDHEIVRRLKAAGAVIIGTTRVPELSVWASSDSPFGVTRNPWDPSRTPGGSSGGSAAAVAAGVVPVAHGNDGMGSIRIPAANTGLFGIKPGRGVVPSGLGHDSWGGMAENGPLTTTVADAALVLAVLAGDPALAVVTEPTGPLRIAVAVGSPSFLVRLSRPWRRSLLAVAATLRDAGHVVEFTRFPYPGNPIPVFARWFAGTAADARALDHSRLEPRTLRHVKLGLRAEKRGWVKQSDADGFETDARTFFAAYDVLITPALARHAPAADLWHRRSWLRNIWSNLQYAPFAAPWNMLGWPAASVPAGVDESSGMPTAVQLVATPGGERAILGLSAQIERLQPWPRLAPGVEATSESIGSGG